jgi:hypothetical protein
MPPLENVSKGKMLSSWKEIAARLGVTVRTVQRWEKLAGLPIHRQGAGKTGRIYAHSIELDRWLAGGGPGRCDPEPTTIKPRLSRRFWPLIAAGALLAAVAGLAAWFGRLEPGAGQPSAWSLERSNLVVRDARGHVCWEKQFPPFNAHFESEVRDKVLIADIDGDGRPEVLFNFFPEDMSRSASSLMCFDAKGGLRWEYRYGREKTFGNRYFEPTYKGMLIRPARVGGKPRLLAVANHYIWYPAQVSLLEARTGRLVEEYWHPGAIYHCALADIDGDGEDEAVFGAINNPGQGIGHAAVGVLKLPFSRVPKRPAGADDAFPPVTGGGELAYALLATPDVNEALALLPIVMALRVDRDRIFVETPLPESGAMVYYLDFKLRVLEYRFSDGFSALHQRLYMQHLLDHRLTPGETDSLGKTALFSSAPDGNSLNLKRFWKY